MTFLSTTSIGKTVGYSKTVSEADVTLFAGISGDFARNHMDEAYMRGTPLGGRIAHGLLLLAYTSRCSTMMAEALLEIWPDWVPLALGFDRIRFIRPVRIGETIALRYTLASVDIERQRMTSSVEICNEAGDVVLACDHIIKWIPANA